MIDRDVRNLEYRVNKLEKSGVSGGGGISSVNLYVSGSETLTGDSFYITGSNINLSSSNSTKVLVISASAGGISEVAISSQAYTNVSSVYTVAGGANFNTSDFTSTNYYFKISGYVDSPCTMSIQLYNLTDAAVVTTVDITSTVATSSDVTSVSLTGNKFYETRFKRVGGTEANNVYLLNSSIKVV